MDGIMKRKRWRVASTSKAGIVLGKSLLMLCMVQSVLAGILGFAGLRASTDSPVAEAIGPSTEPGNYHCIGMPDFAHICMPSYS
jgi:hypothetical protein